MRGEVSDDHGAKLQNATITVLSTGQLFRTGSYGDFGFMLDKLHDTLSFSLDGYQSASLYITSTDYIKAVLKIKPATLYLRKNHLATYIKDFKESAEDMKTGGESYSALIENPFVRCNKSPTATFSPNTNKASYTNIRRFLNMKDVVPPDAVRIEEMLNYFNFQYKEPLEDSMFHFTSSLTTCPWNKRSELLFLNICSRKMDLHNIPQSNLVFLIDISGSMDLPNKLPLIKDGLKLLVNHLRDIDTVSIITYGTNVSLVMEGVSGADKRKLLDAIEGLQAGGSTPGEAGIRLAYKIVQRRLNKKGNNRIILATDGDFNVGYSKEKDLEELIDQQKKWGVYLSCFGVGMGNYKDSKLSLLAQKGHGNFSYIDNEQEAEKVFVTELTQTLYSVADNVSLTARFNPRIVHSYRLIGYDNKRRALADTSSKVDGGEMSSGQSLMALFELVPNDSVSVNEDLGKISIQYNLPMDSTEHTVSYACRNDVKSFETANSLCRQSAAIALFGMKLKQSAYASKVSWKNLLILSSACFNDKNILSNDYLQLVNKAKDIYRHRHKKFIW